MLSANILQQRVEYTQINRTCKQKYLRLWTESKVVPVRIIKAYTGCRGITPFILNLGTRCTWAVNFTIRPLYVQGNSSRYASNRRLDGTRRRFGRFAEEKIVLPSLDSVLINCQVELSLCVTSVTRESLVSRGRCWNCDAFSCRLSRVILNEGKLIKVTFQFKRQSILRLLFN